MTGAEQTGQRWPRGAPQLPQKREVAGFSVAHASQRIVIAPSWPTGASETSLLLELFGRASAGSSSRTGPRLRSRG